MKETIIYLYFSEPSRALEMTIMRSRLSMLTYGSADTGGNRSVNTRAKGSVLATIMSSA